MPQDTDEIVVAANGNIYVAPVGTAEPADVATAWPAGWVDLGYASEDGVTVTDSKTLERIPVWQLFYPARLIITERDFRVAFSLRQWNTSTVRLAFGGGTVTDTAGAAPYTFTPPAPGAIDDRALGVEFIHGAFTYRLVVPRGMVTDDVESQLVRTAAADLPITFGVIGQAGADPWFLMSDDPAMAPAAV